MNLKYLDVELEAFFPYWFTADVKNRNFGIKSYPPEDAGDMKVTGFSIKASSAPPITKEILGKVFTLISNGKDEDEVYEEIRDTILHAYKGGMSISNVSSYGSLSKDLDEYDKVVPNAAKAARYSNQYNGTDFGKRDSVKWVFIDDVPEGQPYCNVIAYDNESELEGYSIDWGTVVNKWVHKKLKSVYETLNWNLDGLTARRVPKRFW